MTLVLLACKDLMTVSRLELAGGVDVRRFSDDDQLLAAIADAPDAVIVVDLTAAPHLPAKVRSSDLGTDVAMLAFAPHVQEELMDAAREFADLVVPRGSVMKGFDRQVRRAKEIRGNTAPGSSR
ncbi:MAG: hypothetical protein KDC46_05390 [Thermoleophilia bacterium]|nr:hypothetical protein [Thermoleophilia bacterium]